MRIIVHIGAGKTGTSSIQMTLKENQQQLHRLGFHYMGLVLEHASIKKFIWQNQHAVNFFAMNDVQACKRFQVSLMTLSNNYQKKEGSGIGNNLF